MEQENIKNLKKIKQNEFFFLHFTIFCENHSPTHHIKYKVIDLAPSTKLIMANKLPSTN